MICRKINHIILNNGVAEIDMQDDLEKEILSNEKYISVLKDFFKSKNLDFKIKEKIVVKNDADELNKLLGGKLIIKHIKNV